MARPGGSAVISLQPHDLGEVVEVLAEAFRGYPVMRHVLGPAHDDDYRIERYVEFVAALLDRLGSDR